MAHLVIALGVHYHLRSRQERSSEYKWDEGDVMEANLVIHKADLLEKTQ